jgi:cardiolipin synthase
MSQNISVKKHYKKFQKFLLEYTWWETAFFVFGAASFFTLIAALFLPLGTLPKKLTFTGTMPASGSTQFLEKISAALDLPVDKGEEIQILNNGDEFMEAFLKDIDSAKYTINMMTYDWSDGEMSDKILEHLTSKVREGVEVRIARDAFGASRASLGDLEDAGGKVWTFHSLNPLPWNIMGAHKRNHRRSIVIDGNIAYIGGQGVTDTRLGNAQDKDHWRDMMFRTTGRMAASIQGAFTELWMGSGEVLLGPKFYPDIQHSKPETVTYVTLNSTPLSDVEKLESLLLFSFIGAGEKIYIANPYFILDDALRTALEDKARGGVDVRIIVPNKYNDSKTVRYASRAGYSSLLESGIKIYEFQPTFIHAKYLVIDDSWSIIGSANMDARSRTLNEENVLGVASSDFGQKMDQVFMDDLQKSTEITKADWSKRGIFERIMEFFSTKLAKQL